VEPMPAALLDRVKRLLPAEDRQPEWGHPSLSTTPTRLAMQGLAARIELLEQAVRQIAAEVQEISPQQRRTD
jgi:hypothetical protein